MPVSVRSLGTAPERRRDVVDAAIGVFARRGYWGTNTTEIAHAAGISQAYLYRLFENKERLFVAVLAEVRARLQSELAATLAGETDAPLDAILASEHRGAPSDPDAGIVLLHATAASSVEAIGEAVRRCYAEQVRFLRDRGLDPAGIRVYLAQSQFAIALRAAGVTPGVRDPDVASLVV